MIARIAVTALGVAVLAGPPTAAARPVALVRSCSPSTLVVWLNTNAGHAAGSTYYDLAFTNLSPRRCTLAGFPGVSAVDLAGRRLGSPATRNRQGGARTLALAPRQTARSVLQVTNVGVFPPARCRPVTAAGLRVFPPNARTSRVVPFPFRACARTGPTYLQVQAVARP